jgi:hypothetical protein
MKIKEPSKFVTMRLPLPVYELIQAAAKAESRSVSGQILHMLKQSIK